MLSGLLAAGILTLLVLPEAREARNFGSAARNLFTITEGDYLNPLLSSPRAVTLLNCAAPGIARFAGYDDFNTRLAIGDRVFVTQITRYNGNLLSLLGIGFEMIQPASGRESLVYISESFWERACARRPDILGTVVTMHDTTYRIAGVTRETTGLLADTEIWLPVTARGMYGSMPSMRILGALEPRTDWAEAQKQLVQCFADFLRDQAYGVAPGPKLVPLEKSVYFQEHAPLLVGMTTPGGKLASKS